MARPPISRVAPPIPRDRSQFHRGNVIIQGIPKDTVLAFKAAVYRQGFTMRDVFIMFMRQYASGTYNSVRPAHRPPCRPGQKAKWRHQNDHTASPERSED